MHEPLGAGMSLLVSVRSVAEAEAALEGGAALIDVKEPIRGSLGPASPDTVASIIRSVAGRLPVSAALGELADPPALLPCPGLGYVKWGLSRLGEQLGWPQALQRAGLALAESVPACRPVAVAYADWQRAAAPSPQQVCAFACRQRWSVFLIDTWLKDGTTLLDWLPLAELQRLCRSCRQDGVRVALAGSLGLSEVEALRPLQPDWFAVRGAVCRNGRRTESVDPDAVRHLSAQIAQPLR